VGGRGLVMVARATAMGTNEASKDSSLGKDSSSRRSF